MEPEPLPYASSNETRPKRRRTNFGAIAVALSAIFSLLIVLAGVLPHKSRSDDLEQQISNFIFDFGFSYMLITLVLIVVGLFRRGSSRWLSLLALVLPFAAAFALAMS